MSISGALNNAMSGLQAMGRASRVVSDNLANALTPGYGVRSLELTSRQLGDTGGVRIVGITRNSDPQLTADRRQAEATEGYRSGRTEFLERFEKILGTPDEFGSISAQIADFEKSLISAASRPDAVDRLDTAVLAAQSLTSGLNNASRELQEMRSTADDQIDIQIRQLNNALADLAELNEDIVAAGAKNQVTAGLLDTRETLLDDISKIVPIRIMDRGNGNIALYTSGGAVLLDGTPAEIEFTASNSVTPYQTLAGGQLSGLTINGTVIDTSSTSGMIRGGSLAANFAIRDELAPEAQEQLDAIARNMIERFEDSSVDPTLGATDPGLFTDAGAMLDPLAEVGLSERIAVNTLVDPNQGGDSWRMRTGLMAATSGDPGDATILQNLADALTDRRVTNSGNFGPGIFSALELNSNLQSQISSELVLAERQLAFSKAQLSELTQLELELGVDTDAEMQRLILIEQAYAANARVISAADEMLERLLGI